MLNWKVKDDGVVGRKAIEASFADYYFEIISRKKKAPYTRVTRLDSYQMLIQHSLYVYKVNGDVKEGVELKTFKFGTRLDKVQNYAKEFVLNELSK